MTDETQFAHVAFDDSYVLGWHATQEDLRLFLQVLLTEQHGSYRPPADDEFGCYRLAVLSLVGTQGVAGLHPDSVSPVWNAKRGEFEDFDEINEVQISEGKLEVFCDKLTISAVFSEIHFRVLEVDGAGAFLP